MRNWKNLPIGPVFLALCLLIGCVGAPLTRDELRQLRRYESPPLEAKSRSISIRGKDIFYWEQGDGTPVVLLHGWPTHSYVWRHVIPRLSRNYRVFAPDLVGYGESKLSPGEGRTVGDQASYVAEMIDELGIGRAIVVGQGTGGAIAQLLAVNYPEHVRGLCLINSACFDSWPSEYAKLLAEPGWGGFTSPLTGHRAGFKGYMKQGVFHQVLLAEGVVNNYFRPWDGPEGRRDLVFSAKALDNRDTQRIEGELSRIRIPTLVIASTFDPFQHLNYSKRLASSIPRAEFVQIKDCGHFATEDEPEKIVKNILAYFGKN